MRVRFSFSFPKLKSKLICPISAVLLPLAEERHISVHWIWLYVMCSLSKQDSLITNSEAPVSHRVRIFLLFITVVPYELSIELLLFPRLISLPVVRVGWYLRLLLSSTNNHFSFIADSCSSWQRNCSIISPSWEPRPGDLDQGLSGRVWILTPLLLPVMYIGPTPNTAGFSCNEQYCSKVVHRHI